MNDLFLRACRRQAVERPPVWMMRQAGRWLPEFRELLDAHGFPTLVRTPELAVRATLQPVDRVGVDAAIIFSDILVLPEAMGMELVFGADSAPRFLHPLRTRADFDRLRDVSPEEGAPFLLEAVRLARRDLEGRVPLIGFAGAPWTLLAYMVEGGPSQSFAHARRLLAEDPYRAHALLARLGTAVGYLLHAQAAAGAQALQIFESAAGALSPDDFRAFCLPYLTQAVGIARQAGVPVIVHAPGAGWALEEIAAGTGADVVGVDWQTPAADARRRLAAHDVALQGNFEPGWLFSPPDVVRQRTLRMLADFGGAGHVANLGHGVLPGTPVEGVRAFVETVQAWRAAPAPPAEAPAREDGTAVISLPASRRARTGAAREKAVAARSMREQATRWIERAHDDITRFFEEADGEGRFREDPWERPGGGGGVSRVMLEGAVFEKAGVNRSAVYGELTPGVNERLGGRVPPDRTANFFVTGVSVVVHPRSPMVPTVHLNVRYFELTADDGEVLDAWVGGGADLTPYYPFPEDAAHFHRALRGICDRHAPTFYPRFKAWCDQYFVNPHRGGEARGVGGIFFDHLRPAEERMTMEGLRRFAEDVGRCFPAAYGSIVQRRRATPYGERERAFQLFRRGRYVEFNLVHDRGTLFGLRTAARIESVLMSLPPVAGWSYAPVWEEGSFEHRLMDMLTPRDWAEAPQLVSAGGAVAAA